MEFQLHELEKALFDAGLRSWETYLDGNRCVYMLPINRWATVLMHTPFVIRDGEPQLEEGRPFKFSVEYSNGKKVMTLYFPELYLTQARKGQAFFDLFIMLRHLEKKVRQGFYYRCSCGACRPPRFNPIFDDRPTYGKSWSLSDTCLRGCQERRTNVQEKFARSHR